MLVQSFLEIAFLVGDCLCQRGARLGPCTSNPGLQWKTRLHSLPAAPLTIPTESLSNQSISVQLSSAGSRQLFLRSCLAPPAGTASSLPLALPLPATFSPTWKALGFFPGLLSKIYLLFSLLSSSHSSYGPLARGPSTHLCRCQCYLWRLSMP